MHMHAARGCRPQVAGPIAHTRLQVYLELLRMMLLPEGLDAELAEELMGGGRVSFEARRRETAVLTALRMQFVTLGM